MAVLLLFFALALSVGFSMYIYDRLVKLESAVAMIQYGTGIDYIGVVKKECV